MSVLAVKRNESQFEVVVYPSRINDILIDLMKRNFGVRDLDHFVRMRYARGLDTREDFEMYRHLMRKAKDRVSQYAALLIVNVRAANGVYPTSHEEYALRRDFQNNAIVHCNQIKSELQEVVKIFDVDVNTMKQAIEAVDREIGLIKRWRQNDNKRYKAFIVG